MQNKNLVLAYQPSELVSTNKYLISDRRQIVLLGSGVTRFLSGPVRVITMVATNRNYNLKSEPFIEFMWLYNLKSVTRRK